MVDCCILIPLHPMLGIDYHDLIPPPPAPPTPVPFNPYFVMQILGGVSGTAKYATKTYTMSFPPMEQGTDIGKLIGHVGNPLNLLLPLHIIFSASKSLFGASSVKIEDKVVATACFVFANQNLNCNNPADLPTGSVCAPNTVMAGMSLGDFLSGALNTAAQVGIGFAFSKMGNHLGTGKLAEKMTQSFFRNAIWRGVVGSSLKSKTKGSVERVASSFLDKGLGMVIDGVLNKGGWENTGKMLSDALGEGTDYTADAVADYFNDTEEIGVTSESEGNYINSNPPQV